MKPSTYIDLLHLRTKRIHIYTACTGAGTGIPDELWKIPGIGSVFIGASIPYAAEDLERFLGFKPGNCSEETAMDMAMEAYIRAFQPGSKHMPMGLGITASVATTEAHRGDHRVHAAVMTDMGMFTKTLILEKGVGPEARERDGAIVNELGLRMLLQHTARVVASTDTGLGEYTHRTPEAYERFLSRPVFWSDGTRRETLEDTTTIFPGAFNPPHDGHFGIADQFPGGAVFSITVDPPHKHALGLKSVLKRAKRMQGHKLVFVKGEPLYIDKARRNPGKAFVIGVDALIRMLDPKWGVEVEPLLQEFSDLGTRFHVVGREVGGEWRTLRDLEAIPPKYAQLFQSVEGRWDVSSTQIREGAA